MPRECETIRKEYDNLKALKNEFDLVYQQAVETGNLSKAKKLKGQMEEARDTLTAKLWTFEKLPQPELKKQYARQKETLESLGILEKLTSGESGIKAIDGQEYAFPSYQEVAQRMKQNREILKPKIEQGFNQLLIVPFGMKLDDLIDKYRQAILTHHQEGKLLATKEKPTDVDEPLELDESQPVWAWDKYPNADVSGELVYYPKEFKQDTAKHKGKTKQAILKEQGGFNVLLIENLPNIPRAGKGKTIQGRKQLEAGQTPNKYLETLATDSIYKDETGMTPEEQLTYALQYLEATNQVIDDYSGKGSLSYQLGAYFPASGYVPDAYWSRVVRRAGLGGYAPGRSDSAGGPRVSVRV